MRKLLVLLTVFMCMATVNVHAASLGLQNAKTFAEIGDWENGIKFLEAYILENPEDAEARLLLAECYFNWPDRQSVGETSTDKNLPRGQAQIQILGNLGDEGHDMLIKGLTSETHKVFYACCEVLTAKRDRRAVQVLMDIAEKEVREQYQPMGFVWRVGASGRRSYYGLGSVRLANNEYSRVEHIIPALVNIELERDEVDPRIAQFLTSLLEIPDIPRYLARLATGGLTTLGVKEAVPSIQNVMQTIVSELPAQAEGVRRNKLDELLFYFDAFVLLSPENGEQHARDLMTTLGYQTSAEMLYELRDVTDTLAHMTNAALDLLDEYPGFWRMGNTRFEMVEYLQGVHNVAPDVLERNEIKQRLLGLCDAPHPNIREGIVILYRVIGYEDAIPVLLPRLCAERSATGFLIPSGEGVGRPPERIVRMRDGEQVTTAVELEHFVWQSKEQARIWYEMKQIGSPRTADFLLDKLQSDDLAWVYTAARLLEDIGEGRAIELLRKRYTELVGKEDDVTKNVVSALKSAYKTLSGQTIDGSTDTVVEPQPPMPRRVRRVG